MWSWLHLCFCVVLLYGVCLQLLMTCMISLQSLEKASSLHHHDGTKHPFTWPLNVIISPSAFSNTITVALSKVGASSRRFSCSYYTVCVLVKYVYVYVNMCPCLFLHQFQLSDMCCREICRRVRYLHFWNGNRNEHLVDVNRKAICFIILFTLCACLICSIAKWSNSIYLLFCFSAATSYRSLSLSTTLKWNNKKVWFHSRKDIKVYFAYFGLNSKNRSGVYKPR